MTEPADVVADCFDVVEPLDAAEEEVAAVLVGFGALPGFAVFAGLAVLVGLAGLFGLAVLVGLRVLRGFAAVAGALGDFVDTVLGVGEGLGAASRDGGAP